MKHLTLQDAREARGWTQVVLAKRAHVQQAHISKLERGVITDPGASTVAALERALRLRPGTLVFGRQGVAVSA